MRVGANGVDASHLARQISGPVALHVAFQDCAELVARVCDAAGDPFELRILQRAVRGLLYVLQYPRPGFVRGEIVALVFCVSREVCCETVEVRSVLCNPLQRFGVPGNGSEELFNVSGRHGYALSCECSVAMMVRSRPFPQAPT